MVLILVPRNWFKAHFTDSDTTLPKVDVILRDGDGKTALDHAGDDDDDDDEDDEEDEDDEDVKVAKVLRSRDTLLELGHTCWSRPIIRTDRKSLVWQCLGFCSADS